MVDLWHESIANMLAEGMDDETIMGFLDRQDRNASRRVKSYADKGLTGIHCEGTWQNGVSGESAVRDAVQEFADMP